MKKDFSNVQTKKRKNKYKKRNKKRSPDNKFVFNKVIAEKNLKDLSYSMLNSLKIPVKMKEVKMPPLKYTTMKNYSKKLEWVIKRNEVLSAFQYERKSKLKKIDKLLLILEQKANQTDLKRQAPTLNVVKKAPKSSLNSHRIRDINFNEYGSNRRILKSNARKNETYNSLRSRYSNGIITCEIWRKVNVKAAAKWRILIVTRMAQ